MDWISVKDRLPEIEKPVLVEVVGMPSQYRRMMVTVRWESGWGNLLREEYVTHWMPLPAPPEATHDD